MTTTKKSRKGVGGRPSAYKPEFALAAKKLCKMGATDADLAEAFGVSEQTINSWKKKYPEFLESIKEKNYSDDEVVRSLFMRATGKGTIPDSDIRVIDGEVVITPLVKHFPPDVTACIFWLQNRQKDKWKPRKQAEDHGDEGEAPPVSITFQVKPPVSEVKITKGEGK